MVFNHFLVTQKFQTKPHETTNKKTVLQDNFGFLGKSIYRTLKIAALNVEKLENV